MKTTRLLALAVTLAASALAQHPDTLKLSVPPPPVGVQSDARLGLSAAVAGGLTVMGAPFDDTGAVDAGVAKMFDTATGALLHLIPNPNPVQGDQFGSAVAISGTRVVVGTPNADPGATEAGAAYVFDLASATPTVPVATLNHPSPTGGTYFGVSVGISGTRVVVGARGNGTGVFHAGGAYVYDLASPTPTVPVATLNNPNPGASDQFGWPVAISGARVVVSARDDATGTTGAGSAYVYDLAGGTPTVPVATLHNPGPAEGERFGETVAIDGMRMVVGSVGNVSLAGNAGTAYVYDLASPTPTVPVATLDNPGPQTFNRFAESLAISGTRVAVGAYSDDTGGSSA